MTVSTAIDAAFIKHFEADVHTAYRISGTACDSRSHEMAQKVHDRPDEFGLRQVRAFRRSFRARDLFQAHT